MIKIGTGYDVHALVKERKLILGGVEIPYEKGLLGHSDADVLLHAICDAMLGACALGDIGKHFPDSDPKYKGISSIELLKHVKNLILPYKVSNLDTTIVAQAPKLSKYISDMRKNISDTLEIDVNCVSVKATTTEHLGFCGRGEGIEAQAVCILTK